MRPLINPWHPKSRDHPYQVTTLRVNVMALKDGFNYRTTMEPFTGGRERFWDRWQYKTCGGFFFPYEIFPFPFFYSYIRISFLNFIFNSRRDYITFYLSYTWNKLLREKEVSFSLYEDLFYIRKESYMEYIFGDKKV